MYTLKRLLEFLLFSFGLRLGRVPRSPSAEILDCLSELRPHALSEGLIRAGAENDGGYLIPANIDDLAIGALISPGVGNVIEFEKFFASRNIPCFLFDASVSTPKSLPPEMSFFPKFVGASWRTKSENSRDYFALSDVIRLASAQKVDKELALQLDVEGHEWEILIDASPEQLRLFSLLIIEFHSLGNFLSNDATAKVATYVFQKLLEDFVVVHLHANNAGGSTLVDEQTRVPNLLEMTLVRRDKLRQEDIELQERKQGVSAPHPLDTRNIRSLPDVALPKMWT